jgi:hypothetical protein
MLDAGHYFMHVGEVGSTWLRGRVKKKTVLFVVDWLPLALAPCRCRRSGAAFAAASSAPLLSQQRWRCIRTLYRAAAHALLLLMPVPLHYQLNFGVDSLRKFSQHQVPAPFVRASHLR